MLAAAQAGLGIALLPCYLGDSAAGLLRIVLPDEPRRGIWLTVHRDLQHSPRVCAVLDAFASMLAADADMLRGDVVAAPTAVEAPKPAPPELPNKRGLRGKARC